MKELGIDEAGRGPVIGPLVIAGVIVDEKLKKDLKDIGVRDSKKIAPKKREKMFEIIQKNTKHKILIVSPQEIDSALRSEELNLNKLEALKSAEIINSLRPETVILDSPSHNLVAYASQVREHIGDSLKDSVKLVSENKADENHVSAGAASILAKVTRDSEMEKLKEKLGVDFGSGYPSDPLTKKFVEENWNNKKYAGIFRETWESFKRLKEAKNQSNLRDF